MADKDFDPITELGLGTRARPESAMSAGERLALVAAILWILASGGFFLFAPASEGDGFPSLRFVMTLVAVFLPVAVLWVGVLAARSARVMRAESVRLQSAITALRQSYLNERGAAAPGGKSSVERKLEEIAAAQRKTESAIAMFSSSRVIQQAAAASATKPALPHGETTPGGEEQGLLALNTPVDAMTEPVSVADFIRALNFPENANDKEGFQALRRALRDRGTARLIQAAEDVLTLLSHDGIYMEDLRPDRARPEVWRKFAQGERGRAVAALGGIYDRSCLALTAGRMRQDMVFRDSVHHFLRRFDQIFAGFEKTASDADIAALSDTRTARAFMLLGRVAGTFD